MYLLTGFYRNINENKIKCLEIEKWWMEQLIITQCLINEILIRYVISFIKLNIDLKRKDPLIIYLNLFCIQFISKNENVPLEIFLNLF